MWREHAVRRDSTEGPPDETSADQPVSVVASETIYEGRVVQLRVDTIDLPERGRVTREVVEHPGAVVVAALDDEDCVYLVRQYRHPVRRRLLELPAGCLEPGEEPLEAAKRELREEVGVVGRRWTPLGEFFSTPGFVNERMFAFLAEELETGERDLDDDEDISVVRYPLEDLLAHAEWTPDAKTLATLLLVVRARAEH